MHEARFEEDFVFQACSWDGAESWPLGEIRYDMDQAIADAEACAGQW